MHTIKAGIENVLLQVVQLVWKFSPLKDFLCMVSANYILHSSSILNNYICIPVRRRIKALCWGITTSTGSYTPAATLIW